MITAEQTAEIIAMYRGHGWVLRRVLLSEETRRRLGAVEVFGSTETVADSIDALWFSRSARPGEETWEIRHLGPTPFALVDILQDDDSAEERERRLSAMVERLRRDRG